MDKNSINLEQLSNSLKVLDQANNNLNNNSLSNNISELDIYLSKISFEHGNCFKDYKNILEELVVGIDKLKREVNELDIALEKSINSFSDVEKINFRKEDLLTASNEVNKIPIPDTTTQEVSKNNINTIPIGLGIAASGIAGSIGAVVVDSIIPREEHDEIPKYEENNELSESKKVVDEEKVDEFLAREEKFEDVSPYHASRDKKVIDKFYDEEENK